jgi:hypothetical protein
VLFGVVRSTFIFITDGNNGLLGYASMFLSNISDTKENLMNQIVDLLFGVIIRFLISRNQYVKKKRMMSFSSE